MRLLLILVAVAMAGCDSVQEDRPCVPTDDLGNYTACWGKAAIKGAETPVTHPFAAEVVMCDNPQVVYLRNAGCYKAAIKGWARLLSPFTNGACMVVPDGCATGVCLTNWDTQYFTCSSASDCPFEASCKDFSTF